MFEDVFKNEEEAEAYLLRADMVPYAADVAKMRAEGYTAIEIAEWYWYADEE